VSDDPQTRRKLEAITGAGDPPAGELGAEETALRQAWVAFGRLLEQEEARLPPPQVPTPTVPVAETVVWTPVDAHARLRQIEARNRKPARRWPVAVALVTAASLLLAVAWAVFGPRGGGRVTTPSVDRIAADRPAKSQSKTPPPLVAKGASSGQPQVIATEPTPWNDTLDDELASLASSVLRVQSDWYRPLTGAEAVQDRIGEMEKEIESETL
jgi:hypothetical protein